jgi:hypothetical protein
MATTGIANTPLINYFRYKQSTIVSGNVDSPCFPITAIADGGNGQLVITAGGTDTLTPGVAVTIAATTSYNGNYTVISVTPTTFNVSGVFGVSETGTWELSSNITGANAGDPLDFGTIFFFDNDDQTTPLDTYSDRNLTILNTNPIVLDAVGSAPPIYLLDQPYYIEIYDKFNNLVATLENYLPDDGGNGPDTIVGIENLFPNYGMDSQVNNGDYENTALPVTTTRFQHGISSGWLWELGSAQANPNNTYFFTALDNSGIIGNPKNEVVLKSTNNSNGDTFNNYMTHLGFYNDFQGQQLAVSIFVRVISGVVADIPVQLRRTNQGTLETPITVGSLPVSPTRTQQIISFIVPVLTSSTYANEDTLDLLFNLPLNTDFEIGFTGMWAQLSDDGTVDIHESAGSTRTAKETINLFQNLQNPLLYKELGLPLMINSLGVMGTMKRTGEMFTAHINNTINYATRMDFFPGTLLIADNPITQTSTNRLINYLRTNNITQSRLTFIAEKVPSVAEFTITTGIGSAQLTPSSANAGGRITLTKTTNEFQYAVSAKIILNNGLRHVDVTFIDQFAPGQNPHVFSYTNGNGVLYDTPPPSRQIVSWCGVSALSVFSNFQTAHTATFYPTTVAVVNEVIGSGSTNAVVRLKFQSEGDVMRPKEASTRTDQGEDPLIPVLAANSNYLNTFQTFWAQEVPTAGSVTINTNYLAYNDISSNPATQANPPPHVIRFHVDGVGGQTAPSGTLTTAIININTGDSGTDVALRFSETINTAWLETGVVVSTPNNGDNLFISNPTTDFIIIYFDTTQTKPANPVPARTPIFVEYTPATSLEDIAQATADAVNASMAAIPYYPDLGLPPVETGTYYIVN